MSPSAVAEDSVGAPVGRAGRHRQERTVARRTFTRPERTVKTTRAYEDGLGSRHLGLGLTFSGGVIAVFLLWRFAVQWNERPAQFSSLLAWAILVGTVILALATMRRLSTRMPTGVFAGALAIGTVVVVLDLAGCWGQSDAGVYPTAAPAVGALLTAIVTLRETRDILPAIAVLGLVMEVAAVAEARVDTHTLAPGILSIALGVVPPLLGVAIVRAFRRMVQRELDLVLVQSTVSQPRFAVGMLASEQLARLDLDAETLLDDVAQKRAPLPLAPEMANTATSLATQLRLHLINGRSETWLHHAVTESEFLEPSVTVHDPSGLAGLLSREQRDALLLTIWLLISDTERPAPKISIVLGPIAPRHGVVAGRKVTFPIELVTAGVPRRRVDPETWQAIRIVGPHVDSIRDGSLRVEIDCSVDNPADT